MKILVKLLKRLKFVLPMYILGLTLSVISQYTSVYMPIIIKDIIDEVIIPLTKGETLNRVLLNRYSIMFLAFIFISTITSLLSLIILIRCSNKIIKNLRDDLYKKIQTLPVSYFDDKPAGKISSLIINDTETINKNFYSQLIAFLFGLVLRIIMVYFVLFTLDFKVGILAVILIPVFFIWQKMYSSKIKKPQEEFFEKKSLINSMVNEVINGRIMIQLFARKKYMNDEFDIISKGFYENELYMLKYQSTISWPLVTLLDNFFKFLVLSLIGYYFIGGKLGLSVGYIYVIIDYVSKIFLYLGDIVTKIPDVSRSLETGKRVYKLLEEDNESDSGEVLKVEEGNVEFKNVNFSYIEGHKVLNNISFEVKKGESIAFVGHTGSGKSSIMNLLFRFYDADSGEILIDNKNILNYSRESVRAEMGIVLQDPYLFQGTIASNIDMGNDAITEKDVLESIEKVGAGFMLEKLEKGIYTEVTEKGGQFSSGERQLISFARTLAFNPKILILDEATSHIDTETEEIIQKAMDVVKTGRTSFIIAHRLSTVQNADKIIVLDKGNIVERGNHKELIELNGIYAKMYNTQQKI